MAWNFNTPITISLKANYDIPAGTTTSTYVQGFVIPGYGGIADNNTSMTNLVALVNQGYQSDNIHRKVWCFNPGTLPFVYPPSGYVNDGTRIIGLASDKFATGEHEFITDLQGAIVGISFFDFTTTVAIPKDSYFTMTFGILEETSTSSGGGTSTPPSTGTPSVTAPATPTPVPLTGGSILLLHSDTDPPTQPATPTAADFFADGAAVVPATSTSTDPYNFTTDFLSSVPLTNNSLNTIYYYLMDVAQNIASLGSVSFYIDQDKPVNITVTNPTISSPYTAEWLGKNKLRAYSGYIQVCDNPV